MKPKTKTADHTSTRSKAAPKLLPAPSSIMQFESEIEERHFQSFQSDLLAELAEAFDNRFWKRVIMQGCHNEPFILKTVTALSALSTAKRLTQTTAFDQMIPSSAVTMAASHLSFAFMEYAKGLRLLDLMLRDQAAPRKALVMCLLVLCFEGMAGNTLGAVNHAKSGQKLLDDWINRHTSPSDLGTGIKSPAKYDVEDEVVQAAAFFDLQIVGFFDTRPQKEHATRKDEGAQSLRYMPANFQSNDEARVYWQLILKRIRHFIAESVESTSQFPFRDVPAAALPGVEYFSSAECLDPDPMIISATMGFKQEQMKYRQEIMAWKSSFRELYQRTKALTEKRAIIAAQTLLIQALNYLIVAAGMTDTDNMYFDDYLLDFKEILQLCREVIQAKKDMSNGRFCFEMGIMPALHTTAKWCRDRNTRREAIYLMQWYSSREGYWCSATMANLNTALMQVEEQGIEEAVIPEHARVKLMGFKANHTDGLITLNYIVGSPRTGQKKGQVGYSWELPGPWPRESRPVSNSFPLIALTKVQKDLSGRQLDH